MTTTYLEQGKWLQCGIRYGTPNERKITPMEFSVPVTESQSLLHLFQFFPYIFVYLKILLAPHNVEYFHPHCIDFFLNMREVGREELACV